MRNQRRIPAWKPSVRLYWEAWHRRDAVQRPAGGGRDGPDSGKPAGRTESVHRPGAGDRRAARAAAADARADAVRARGHRQDPAGAAPADRGRSRVSRGDMARGAGRPAAARAGRPPGGGGPRHRRGGRAPAARDAGRRAAAATVWQVPPLSVAPAGVVPEAGDAQRYESVRLFAERAAASCPGFAVGPDNIAAVASICRALDGMPLAIELAAARVRALPVRQIGAHLDDRLGLLTAGDRSAAPRQQTLRAAIGWSYDLLTAAERSLFRRLSVFTGWSLEMAEQVCADDAVPARDVLSLTAALVDKSLVLP